MPTSRSDIALLRRAVRNGWSVPVNVRDAIVGEIREELQASSADFRELRRGLAFVRVLIDMERANQRKERGRRASLPGEWPTG